MTKNTNNFPPVGFLPDLRAMTPTGMGVIAIVIASVVLYWPSFAWLGGEWATTAGAFSHGFLVVAISAWLIMRALPAIGHDKMEVRPAGLVALALVSFAWLLSHLASVALLEGALLPLIILAALFAALGKPALVSLGFPVLYLYFAMPAWEKIQFIFQQMTVYVVHLLVRAIDIPVYVEGDMVHLPNGSFEVAGGCSGLGFILTGTAVAALYGYLYYNRLGTRLLLVGIAFAMAVLLNWIRVFIIVVVGNAYDMQHALVEDHLTFGWILFVFTLVPLFLFANRLHRIAGERDEVHGGPGNLADELAVDWGRHNVALVVVAILVVTAVAPAWAWTVQRPLENTDGVALELPPVQSGWFGPTSVPTIWRPRFEGASAETQGVYESENGGVWLYANVYLQQRQGEELVFFRNTVAGNLRRSAIAMVAVDLPPELPAEIVQLDVAGLGGHWLIWYWYEVGGTIATGDLEVKALQAIKTLSGPVEAGIVAAAAPCNPDCGTARANLADLLQRLGMSIRLQQMLVER